MIKFKLKVELAKADMTQKALAEKTGIRPSTISDISKGTVKHLPVEALNLRDTGLSARRSYGIYRR